MKSEEKNSNNNSFVRWQGRSLEELGKTINLLLTISLATIGFVLNIILNKDFYFQNCYSKMAITLGTFVVLTSIILLLVISKNRLLSFKLTTSIARKREKKKMDGIEKLRERVSKKDENIWSLFNTSVWFFGIGEGSLIIGFLIQILYKLG